MNWFVMLAGGLYVGAAIQYAWKGDWVLAGVFVSYASANFFLLGVK